MWMCFYKKSFVTLNILKERIIIIMKRLVVLRIIE